MSVLTNSSGARVWPGAFSSITGIGGQYLQYLKSLKEVEWWIIILRLQIIHEAQK